MALLWSHREKGVLYQVRAAGSSRRLYADGVLHTQFNPRRIVTGSVWDLLWLPVFFLTAPRVERVLVLGAGAGAVIRQLDMLFQPKEIVAVENNPVHLRVAREFFGVTRQMTVLHEVDAAEFVRRYRGGSFDLSLMIFSLPAAMWLGVHCRVIPAGSNNWYAIFERTAYCV